MTRDGQFRLCWWAEHQRRPVSAAQLALDDILQADRTSTRRGKRLLEPTLPRIFQTHPFPLRIPYPLSQAVSATAVSPNRLLVVTHDRRLLCFDGYAAPPPT